MTSDKKSTLSPENAFGNVQQVVRQCKNPALSMDESDTLRESLQVIADRIVLARDLEPKVAELEAKIVSLEAEKTELETKAASASIPAGFVLVPASQAAAAPAPVAAPAAPALNLVPPNGAPSAS